MRIQIAFALFALSGCVVMTKTTTTTRSAGTQRSVLHSGPSRGLSLTTTAKSGSVIVHAIRHRECHRDVFAVTEVTHHRGLRMGSPDDPRAGAFGAILAPVTLPISLLISGVAVAASDDASHEIMKVIRTETTRCDEPAQDVHVKIQLASGEIVERRSDVDGLVSLHLPPGEPYSGVIIARAESETAELKYRRKPPAVTVVRDAVTSCAATSSVAGAVEVRVDVDPEGVGRAVHTDVDNAELTACITTQIADARFPERQRGQTIVLPMLLGQ